MEMQTSNYTLPLLGAQNGTFPGLYQYTRYDIEKDENAARICRDLGGSGVPVIRIGSNVVHGYNPDAVMSYLGK
jgi:hypothetical protein